MKKLASMILLATSVSLASLAALQPASAQTYRHHPAQNLETSEVRAGDGYRTGPNSWFNIDRADRASSPYAGGGGI